MSSKKSIIRRILFFPLMCCISFTLVACTFLWDTVADVETLKNKEQIANCSFSRHDKWWETSFSSLPKDVPNNSVTGEPEFCEFYQFAQDYFLYLISNNNKQESNFLDQQQFPLLETNGTNSCDDDYPKNAFNVRLTKSVNDHSPFVLPERVNQAGANAIYDQNGNIVFYEVRFSKNLCDYKSIQSQNNFPGKTIELKMAWKVLEAKDNIKDFYHIEARIAGENYLLGLVGWHIVISADNHPEMVWVTVEHHGNTIACQSIPQKNINRSFISSSCAADQTHCNNLNLTVPADGLKIPVSSGDIPDICEAFPYGTVANQPIDTNDGLNVALIVKLNKAMQNLLAAPNVPKNLTVWKNYQIKGALWVSNIQEDSSVQSNQRGSLKLANTVMETEFQGGSWGGKTGLNCFSCHNYKATSKNTSNTSTLSHIFDDIISGQEN